MKFLILFFTLAVVCMVAALDISKEEKKIFREWRKQYKKMYKSNEEEQKALEKFVVNLRSIEEHNKLYDEGKVSFKRKIWEYSDYSLEDKRKYLHGLKVPDNLRETRASGNYPSFPPGPKSIDWTKKGLVGPVENQGGCGSCWAFSTAALVEAVMRKKYKNKALMSPQQLVDCSHIGTTGCIGGWPEFALDYVKMNGIADEEEYPYVAYQRTCEYTANEKVGVITGVHNIPTRGNETWMRDIVASVGPVSVVICVEESFHDWNGEGVYNPTTCCDKFDHAPVVVGYGTDPVGGDYWLVKNSWGTSFGDNGYIRMARNRGNLCNIAYYAVYAT